MSVLCGWRYLYGPWFPSRSRVLASVAGDIYSFKDSICSLRKFKYVPTSTPALTNASLRELELSQECLFVDSRTKTPIALC